ncbi:MAG: hypothetical protein H7Y38_07000 [Armatimonadetes bacterium]|nr:hypothetical protein [Armatimonadota bacterium]
MPGITKPGGAKPETSGTHGTKAGRFRRHCHKNRPALRVFRFPYFIVQTSVFPTICVADRTSREGETPRYAETNCMDELPLLLADGVAALPDPLGVGTFLHFEADATASRHVFAVGAGVGITRFVAQHRYEPFWMTVATGERLGAVPVETQFLLAELDNGRFALFVPLIDFLLRCSLQGDGADGLQLVAETGDPAARQESATGLFVAVGDDPYSLISGAAMAVSKYLGTTRLRFEKPLPAFCDDFGWCTWDAFYQDVSHDKVIEGLESWKAAGITPRFLILDDGWQSVSEDTTGEKRLIGFCANEKFPGDLYTTVSMAKNDFGVETFLVWHAFNGYWGGVVAEAFPGCNAVSIARESSEGIKSHAPNVDNYFGNIVGVVPPDEVYRFFHDYHRYLRSQGVDGVKVDSQASLETVVRGLGVGGRVPAMRSYREALEGSVAVHFEGRLINCMSCANEMLFQAPASNLTRTSTDFWPDKPESHGLHLWVNAHVSAWWGQFVHPDWDMFQSGHPMGLYHAAGRAVSGSPIYVSDKPGTHDVSVLRRLVTPEGRVFRCASPGVPTRDCLFADVTKDAVLLKIVNVSGGAAHLLGVFNARHSETGTEPITGAVTLADAPSLADEAVAVYAHLARELRVLRGADRWEITLAQLRCEVFTLLPLSGYGVTPIGLGNYFNAPGAIVEVAVSEDGKTHDITLSTSGEFVAHCESAPVSVEVSGDPAPFDYDADAKTLRVAVDSAWFGTVRVVLA